MAIVLVRKFSIRHNGALLPVLAIRERRDGVDYLVRGVPEPGNNGGEKVWVPDGDVWQVALDGEDAQNAD